MTHALDHVVASGDTVSLVQRCRYPDGSRVTVSSVLDIEDDGRIARQEALQAWDARPGGRRGPGRGVQGLRPA